MMTRKKQPVSDPGSEAAEPSPGDTPDKTPRSEREFLRKVRDNLDDAADNVEGPAAAVERGTRKGRSNV
jgi:hypothetical protein